MKNILLIGLGRFGRHVAIQLNNLGHEVMAVDNNEERVNEVLPFVTNAQIGDSTNADFLKSLGIGNFDVCMVTIGGNFQNSLETTSLLKELGAKTVVSRAERDVQPKIWQFSDLKVGEEQSYTLYNESGHKRRIFQNILDAKAGDPVICYEANPVKKVVALAKITQENNGKELYFEKIENLISPIEYSTLKDCPELEKMEFFVQQNGSLFKLSEGEYNFILDLIREENPAPVRSIASNAYTKSDFLNSVFLSEPRYDVLVSLLRRKKNVILQGAPGVGKTYAAKRLAYSMMGQADSSRIEFVQFHQNYSYEDFMLGYRPDGSGFKLTEGVFYRFCQKASNDSDREYFFLIDEII